MGCDDVAATSECTHFAKMRMEEAPKLGRRLGSLSGDTSKNVYKIGHCLGPERVGKLRVGKHGSCSFRNCADVALCAITL